MLDFRSIIGPFWKQLYRHLIHTVPSTRFLFQPEWCTRTVEHSKGGLSLKPILKMFHTYVDQLDIRASYPSTILENNFCYTTLLKNPKETIKKNNWKEGEDYIRIELSKESPDFIVHVDDGNTNGGGDSDEKSKNEKDAKPTKRSRDFDIVEDASYFVTKKHRTGILSEKITHHMNQRDLFDSIKDILGSKLVKFFLNRIYGMLRSETLFYRAIIACSITTMAQSSLKKLCKITNETIRDLYIRDDDDSTQDYPLIISGDTDGIMVSNCNPMLNQEILSRFNKEFQHIKIKGSTHYDVVYMLNQKCYFAYEGTKDILIEKGSDSIRQDRFLFTKKLCRQITHTLMKCVYEKRGNKNLYDNTMTHIKESMENVSKLEKISESTLGLDWINELTEDKYQEKRFRFLAQDSMTGKVELRRAIQEAKSKVAPLLVLLKNQCIPNEK
jgi:DNA polymerase elongation subunit (family B)